MKARQIIEDESAKDFILRAGQHNRLTCQSCQADLSKDYSVVRTYTSRIEHICDAESAGHYNLDGTRLIYKTDKRAAMTGEDHDLLDDCDTCAECGNYL